MFFKTAFVATLLASLSSFALAAPRPSPVAERAASGTLTAIVTATPAHGEYFGPVTIDGTTYNLLFDTGSSSLWIKGQGSGPRWTSKYGSGWVNGSVTSGTVTVGGMTLTSQTYGLADSFDPNYANYDGILGLSPSSTHLSGNSASWVANIKPLLQSQVLGVNLVSGGSSTFAFGTTESQHQSGTVAWAPVNAALKSWQVSLSSFGVSPAANDTSASCYIDTGNTDTYVPFPVSNAYWHNVAGATTSDAGARYQFPCSSTVPAFSPNINGVTYSVSGAYETFQITGGCGSRLQGSSSSCNLGQPFMYSYYSIFDYANSRIGFVKRV